MDFTLGLVTGMYAVVAVIVFYVVYVIEVKLGMAKILTLSHFLHLSHTQIHTHLTIYTLTRLEVTKFSLFIVSIFANPALLLAQFWVLFLHWHCSLHLLSDLPAIVNGYNNSSNGNTTNNNNNNNELADISQTRLRSLIETIIAETLRSSSLSASGAVSEISLDTRSHVSELANGNGLKRRHRTEHYFEPKIYQDLLATAVLNKVRK